MQPEKIQVKLLVKKYQEEAERVIIYQLDSMFTRDVVAGIVSNYLRNCLNELDGVNLISEYKQDSYD